MDPEEMRRVMEATRYIAVTPRELTLRLGPESASFGLPGDSVVALPLNGEEEAVVVGEVEYYAMARWTEEGLEIRRKVNRGGGVEDQIHVDQEGRLVVEREIDALRGGKVKGTLRYQRKED